MSSPLVLGQTKPFIIIGEGVHRIRQHKLRSQEPTSSRALRKTRIFTTFFKSYKSGNNLKVHLTIRDAKKYIAFEIIAINNQKYPIF